LIITYTDYENGGIYQSGKATLRKQPPHTANMQKKKAMVYKIISLLSDTANNKRNENLRGYRLGTVSVKTILHWGI
jgi:hypothetical protein